MVYHIETARSRDAILLLEEEGELGRLRMRKEKEDLEKGRGRKMVESSTLDNGSKLWLLHSVPGHRTDTEAATRIER